LERVLFVKARGLNIAEPVAAFALPRSLDQF
jgi:hypothetical protein